MRRVEEMTNHRNEREAGQSTVELALVLPLFLVMIFAIIEIGRAFAAKQALTIAAREGARVLVLPYGAGLTYTSESAVQDAAIARVKSYLASSGVPIGSETVIQIARIGAGNDGVYGSTDDPAPEMGYTQGVRGQRVGVVIMHSFESPAPFIVSMFRAPNSKETSPGSAIIMSATCYMDHE